MERTFLESFGLEKDQVDQVLNQHSKEIGQKVNEIESLKSQLVNKDEAIATANSTIDGLKKSNKDNEGLQEKINDYKNQMKEMQQRFESEKIKTTVLSELRVAGARDPELVYTLIDEQALGLNKDGQVIGYEDQISKLTTDETKSYLFQTQEVESQPAPEINVERGGYEAVKGEPSETNFGQIFGQKFAEQRQAQEDSAAQFWAELDK